MNHEPTSGVEAGWKLVPLEPTDKMMLMGGFRFAGKVPNSEVFKEVRKGWDDMLSVAPEPPAALATPAASLEPTSGVEAVAHARYRRAVDEVNRMRDDGTIAPLATPPASPSPAPAAVDVEGLVARLVKPLEWAEKQEGLYERYGKAKTCLGSYELYSFRNLGSSPRTVYGWTSPWLQDQETASWDEAKTAAQADYTARILSAIDATALAKLAADKARIEVERDTYRLALISEKEAAEARASALQVERDRLREGIKPFTDAFDAGRERYAARYKSSREIGYGNFDAMPDSWPMELRFTMGEFRRARAALSAKERAEALSELARNDAELIDMETADARAMIAAAKGES